MGVGNQMKPTLLGLYLIILLNFQVSMAETISVVTESTYPYRYLENDKVVGITVNLVEAVLNRANLDYQISIYPWAKAYKIAKTTPNVLIFSMV